MALPDDFRIKVAFFESVKCQKLKRKYGDHGVLSLIRLWRSAAQDLERCSGDLVNMDAEDIAIAAGFEGDENEFIETLMKIGFIDETNDGFYVLHNYKKRQDWVSGAKERSELARKRAFVDHHRKGKHEFKRIESCSLCIIGKNSIDKKTDGELIEVDVINKNVDSINKKVDVITDTIKENVDTIVLLSSPLPSSHSHNTDQSEIDLGDSANAPPPAPKKKRKRKTKKQALPAGWLSIEDCAAKTAGCEGWDELNAKIKARTKLSFPCLESEWAVARSKADLSGVEYKWAYASRIIQKQREGVLESHRERVIDNSTGTMRTNTAEWDRIREESGGKSEYVNIADYLSD